MATKKTSAEAAKEIVKSDTAKRNALRNQGERYILDKYRAELDEHLEKLYTDNGLSFRKRLTPQERAERKAEEKKAKAKAKLDALIAEYPDLIEGQTSIEDLQNTGGVGD